MTSSLEIKVSFNTPQRIYIDSLCDTLNKLLQSASDGANRYVQRKADYLAQTGADEVKRQFAALIFAKNLWWMRVQIAAIEELMSALASAAPRVAHSAQRKRKLDAPMRALLQSDVIGAYETLARAKGTLRSIQETVVVSEQIEETITAAFLEAVRLAPTAENAESFPFKG
jgi:hypothetical protein